MKSYHVREKWKSWWDSSTRNVKGWHEIRCLLHSIIATTSHSILGLSKLFNSIFPRNTSQLTRNNKSVHVKCDPVKMCKTSLEMEIPNIMNFFFIVSPCILIQ